jgi:hypothetical protein
MSRFRCRETGHGFVLGESFKPTGETEMTHTLLGADRVTHSKILATAMAGAIAVVLVGMNAGLSGGNAAARRTQVSGTAVKAGKPAISVALDTTTIR